MKQRAITSESELADIIKADPWMMDVLQAAETLNLPNWWIGAGFFRNKIWDYIAGNPASNSRDIDLVYFDAGNATWEQDAAYDKTMKEKFPFAEWEVRNQARMHYMNNLPPYNSTEDGIAHWVETATCTAVRLRNEKLEFLFCYGTEDLFGMIARPIPLFQTPDRIGRFHERVTEKHWQERWPDLKIISKQ